MAFTSFVDDVMRSFHFVGVLSINCYAAYVKADGRLIPCDCSTFKDDSEFFFTLCYFFLVHLSIGVYNFDVMKQLIFVISAHV